VGEPVPETASPASGPNLDEVLICSARERICRDLRREFRRVEATTRVAVCQDDWSEFSPGLVLVDLGDVEPGFRDACLEFEGAETWALADQDSAERLLPALAAGCQDYLFYPVNPAELRLRWKRYREERAERPALDGISGEIHLDFPSQVRYVQPAVEEIVAGCERLCRTGSRTRLNLRVAVAEAVANAILYGNEEQSEKKVRIRARIDPERVAVTVRDEGEGFDPDSIADPTLPENRDRTHGRGVFLLRRLMDEVRYNEIGNEVTLVIRP